MAQQGHVVGGQDGPEVQTLPTASLFRFYRFPWNDRGHDPQHAHIPVRLPSLIGSIPLLTSFSWQDPIQRRKLDLRKLDNAGFQKLVTFVAASGFFIDGYLVSKLKPLLNFLCDHVYEQID